MSVGEITIPITVRRFAWIFFSFRIAGRLHSVWMLPFRAPIWRRRYA